MQNAQQVRDISSSVYTTLLLSTDLACVHCSQEEGVQIAAAVRGREVTIGMGPPHLHMWRALVERFLEVEEIMQKNPFAEMIKKYL